MPEQDVAHYDFVGRVGGETVAARKVDDRDALAIRDVLAFDSLDGDAGKISDALAKTGKCVEKSALAGVGIAGERNAERVRLRLARIERRKQRCSYRRFTAHGDDCSRSDG